MTPREKWRRLRLGLATLSGWRRAGWFVPYRYADTLTPAGDSPAYSAVERVFRDREVAFGNVISRLDAFAEPLRAVASGVPAAGGSWQGRHPRFDQAWFPTLDACAAYALVRDLVPRRIVEVGSGHSTRFLARALADGGINAEIIAIDPAPRADISSLPHVRLIARTVHHAGHATFSSLVSGDVLFIDSSHVLMPGSDVDFLLNRVLPELPAGVLVHIHDVLLPDDYPHAWAWRNYNEQLAIVPLLTGGGWAALFASHFVRTRIADRLARSVAATLPGHPAAFPTSLWLRKM